VIRPRPIGSRATLLALTAVVALASPSSASNDALQVIGRHRVTLSPDQLTAVHVRNPGPPRVLSAITSAPVALAWPSKQPACPAVGSVIKTAAAVATGELVQLRMRRCGKLSLESATVSLWAADDGPVTQLPVEAATDSASRLPLPSAIALKTETGKASSVATCLPGEAAGIVGLVADGDNVLPVRLDRVKRVCHAGNGADLKIDRVDEPGRFEGKIDVNGTSEGGELALKLFVRRSMVLFFGLLLAGMLVATVLSWWVRFGRAWGFVDEHAAAVRASTWRSREELRKQIEPILGGFPSRLDVVSKSAPVSPSKPIDVKLALYTGDEGRLRRLVVLPRQDRLEGGTVTIELDTICATYVEIVSLAGGLATWVKAVKHSHPASPTFTDSEAALSGPIRELGDLRTDLSTAWDWVQQLERFLIWAANIKDVARKEKPDLIGKVDDVVGEAWNTKLTDMSIEALNAKLTSLLQELASRQQVPDPPLMPLANDALRQAFAGQVHEVEEPEAVARRIQQNNVRSEVIVALISLVVAVVSGYAVLYASNPAWGSAADMLAALTWAITAASAVQVARHFTARIAT
jgi:hypothetical protein